MMVLFKALPLINFHQQHMIIDCNDYVDCKRLFGAADNLLPLFEKSECRTFLNVLCMLSSYIIINWTFHCSMFIYS